MIDNRSKYKLLVKDTLIFALGSIGSKIILFFLVPLYTTYLSTDEYGISNLVFTISQFLIPLLSLEIFDAVLRFGLSKSYKKEDVIFNAFVILGVDIILCIVIYPLIGIYKPIKEWRVYLLIYFFLFVLNATQMNFLKVCDKNKQYAAISLIQTVTLCVANIIMIAILHLGIRGYLLSSIISLFVSSLFSFLLGKLWTYLRTGIFDQKLLKEMIVYSSPLILNSVSWWLISSSDKVMIERLVDSSALGIYSVAVKIPALINVIISIFQQAWGISSIKEIETTKDNVFFSKIFRLYCLVVFGTCIIILAWARTFISIYIGGGEQFVLAGNYVPLLLVSAVFSAVSTFYGVLYTALKKTNQIMLTTLISAGVNLVVNYVAISLIGTMGAVIGTVISYIITSVVRMIDMNQYISLNVDYWKYTLNCLVLIVFACIVTFSSQDHFWISLLFISIFIVINNQDIKSLVKIRRS